MNIISHLTRIYKITIASMLMSITYYASAQNTAQKIGNNPTIKEASAILELESTNKGTLLTRVALNSTTDNVTPIPAPVNGLTVFNTAIAGTAPNNVTPGYYFWSSANSRWVRLLDDLTAWSLTGNTGTNPSNNYLGTGDDQDLSIRTSNIEKVRVTSTGNVGIGTNNPTNKLEVNATSDPVKLIGLATGAFENDLLSVDANGVLKRKISGGSSTTISQSFILPPNSLPLPENSVTFTKALPPKPLPNSAFVFSLNKPKSVLISFDASIDDLTVGVYGVSFVRYEVYRNGVPTGVATLQQVTSDGPNLTGIKFSLKFTDTLPAGGPYEYDLRVRRYYNGATFVSNTDQRHGLLSIYATATYVD